MFYILKDKLDVCGGLTDVWTIIGYIIFAIQVVVPLLLIISGMITMAQAVMKQDEKDIKKAQSLLIKKIIAAVIVFLIIAITKIVVSLVATGNWEGCVNCALHPFDDACGFDKANIPGPAGGTGE
jgi:surface polysaccharide O-acyltransferase-like enzyme